MGMQPEAPDMVRYQFQIDDETWEDWKMTVPRDKSLEQRIIELIEADRDGRVREKKRDVANYVVMVRIPDIDVTESIRIQAALSEDEAAAEAINKVAYKHDAPDSAAEVIEAERWDGYPTDDEVKAFDPREDSDA